MEQTFLQACRQEPRIPLSGPGRGLPGAGISLPKPGKCNMQSGSKLAVEGALFFPFQENRFKRFRARKIMYCGITTYHDTAPGMHLAFLEAINQKRGVFHAQTSGFDAFLLSGIIQFCRGDVPNLLLELLETAR
jgi:hypothetical protein